MKMDSPRRPKILAIIITLLLMAILMLVLIFSRLNLSLPENREWPPESRSEIVIEPLEEETFVDVLSDAGDDIDENADSDDYGASDTDSDEPTQLSHDLTDNSPAKAHQTPVTTSKAEAPVQVKTPEKSGAAKAKEEAERSEARRQQEAKKNIETKLNNRFSGASDGKGKTTPTDGTHAGGGTGGGSGLGMTASADVRPRSNKLGTIVVNVTVTPDGTVRPGSASLNLARCSGDAGTDTNLRNNCLKQAYQCRFARRVGESDNVPGTITFKWE